MGYYSDVMLITEMENKDIVEGIFEEYAGSGNPANILEWAENPKGFEYTHYEGPYYDRRERDLIMWEWKGMRWGYGFTRTDEIEQALIAELTYAEGEVGPFNKEYPHYGLIVIGEDLEDTRLEGVPYDYGMDVKRTIDW